MAEVLKNLCDKIGSSKSATIKKLIGWSLADKEDKCGETAIESLVKKLRKNTSALQTLEMAISNPEVQTKCVTIPRSKDGRLQVCHRKGLPHVIYCRLWRWPDLQSPHELRALNCCEHPFSQKSDPEVCINPYHYERVGSRSMPSIKVPKAPIVSDNVPSEFPPPYSPDSDYYSDFSETQDDPNYIKVGYLEDCGWATLAYFELNERVGERFNCKNNIITIDGFTSPNDLDRFCLGGLGNANRNSTIENVRKNIKKGITLHYTDGNIYLEVNSENPVFIQSDVHNWENNRELRSVLKVPPGATEKIFDVRLFGDCITKTMQHGYKALFNLTRMCTIRISFIKGWGNDYYRKEVTATPCWLEIHLNNPLKWLDSVLKVLPGPDPDGITSTS